MMSQNRQEYKDRKRSENDYKVNIKAEEEIKLLHEKIDHLLNEQINIREEINKINKLWKRKSSNISDKWYSVL